MHRFGWWLLNLLLVSLWRWIVAMICGCVSGDPKGKGKSNGKNGAALLVLFGVVALSGCTSPGLDLVYLPDQPQPVPVTDLPVEYRVENWVGTDVDGSRGGSCVHASVINTFRAAGRGDLEAKWYAMRDKGYEGPEADFRVLEKLDAQGVPFIATDGSCEDRDLDVLEAASREGRMAVIFYYPSHSINFVEFAEVNGVMSAVLLDNNFPEYYITVPKDVFVRSWFAYGGFAVVPWIEPVVPRTFPRSIPRRYLDGSNNAIWGG